MLVGRSRPLLVSLLIAGGLVASSAACDDTAADPGPSGLVIPSAPGPLTTMRPHPTGSTTGSTGPTGPVTTSTTSTTGTPTPTRPATTSMTSTKATATPTGPVTTSATSTGSKKFSASVSATTADDVRHTYRAGCPVGPSELRTITMTYRTYAGEVRTGELIVAAQRSTTVVDTFRRAFEAGFRINRMDNPNRWKGDDVQMMAADNTSAFNCRRVTGNPSKLSPHSYGTAIDVNTRRNPYRAADGVWYPSNGSRWIDRSVDDAGVIHPSSVITRAVIDSGGTWGGTWVDPDYQHFELD